MSTAASIFAEGKRHNNEEIDDINSLHDEEDILDAVNKTSGYQQNIQPQESVEMQSKTSSKSQRDGQLYSVDKLEKDEQSKIIIILITALIAYSVIVSTIALIVALNNSSPTTTTSTSCDCTLNSLAAKTDLTDSNDIQQSGFCQIVDVCSIITSNDPTMSPSSNPTINPSKYPSLNPSNYPSMSPTNNPSITPSQLPTSAPTYFDGYFIGDFKYSFKNSDHGFWKLCDGDFLAINGEYQLLFNEIGYTFGEYTDTIFNGSYFKLPNVSDSVVGISGTNHLLGDEIGTETHILSSDEIASHSHLIVRSEHCTTNAMGVGVSIAYACDNPSWVGTEYKYGLHGSSLPPNAFSTSTVGGDQSFSIMQPTNFVANLFIYTGVSG